MKNREVTADAYYSGDMYKNKQAITKGWIFNQTKAVYNPFPHAVENLSAFAIKGLTIDKPAALDTAFKESDTINGFKDLTRAAIKKLLKYERVFIEVVPRSEGDYIQLYNPGEVTVEKRIQNKIAIASVKGEDENGEEVTKTFYYTPDRKEVVEKRGEVEKPIPMPEMRLFEFDADYKVTNLFTLTDQVNQYEWFIYAMSRANGSPMMFTKQLAKLMDEQLKKLSKKHDIDFARMLNTSSPEADAKWLELAGTMIPHMQKQQGEWKAEIQDNYPEINPARVLEGSNVAYETLKLKMAGLETKVDNLRALINRIYKELFLLMFKTSEIGVTFSDIIPRDRDKDLKTVQELNAGGKVSDLTLLAYLEEIGIIKSAEEEKKQLAKEAAEDGGYPGLGEEHE